VANFFKKIGKGLSKLVKSVGKGLKKVGKVVGSVAQFAAPIAAMVPGIGTAISAGLGIVGGLLGPQPEGETAAYQVQGGYGIAQTQPAAQLHQVMPDASPMPLALLGLAALFFLK